MAQHIPGCALHSSARSTLSPPRVQPPSAFSVASPARLQFDPFSRKPPELRYGQGAQPFVSVNHLLLSPTSLSRFARKTYWYQDFFSLFPFWMFLKLSMGLWSGFLCQPGTFRRIKIFSYFFPFGCSLSKYGAVAEISLADGDRSKGLSFFSLFPDWMFPSK